MLLLSASCSHPKRLAPDTYDIYMDFNDHGKAVVLTHEDFCYVVVNADFEVQSPAYSIMEPLSHGYFAATKADGGFSYIVNSNYEPVDSAVYYHTDILPTGLIWASAADGRMKAVNIFTGKTELEENCDFIGVSSTGTVQLTRLSDNYISPRYGIEKKRFFEFMLVDAHGRIKAPWGRFKYMESYSDDRAKFTNEAVEYLKRAQSKYFDEIREMEKTNDAVLHERYGYLDENGDVVIAERFEQCSSFSDGTAYADPVEHDGRPNLIIDKNGETIGHYKPKTSGLF